jgi:hypothetical protein
MNKVLDAYKTTNSLANARRLAAYARKHPFAVCLLTQVDSDLLTEALCLVDGAPSVVAPSFDDPTAQQREIARRSNNGY